MFKLKEDINSHRAKTQAADILERQKTQLLQIILRFKTMILKLCQIF